MNPLTGFSDWALSLLPRLFLYPGGLAVVVALFLALFISRLATGTARKSLLHHALHLLTNANIPALACAWAALAILPLPGASPLPLQVDRFSLVAVAATSLLFDVAYEREHTKDELWSNVAIVLALISPLASHRGLVPGGQEQGIVDYLAGVAVLVGLVGSVGSACYRWSGAARWLAWWGAALTLGALPGDVWGLTTLPAALVVGWTAQRLGWSKYATLLAYALGMIALLTALLLPPG